MHIQNVDVAGPRNSTVYDHTEFPALSRKRLISTLGMRDGKPASKVVRHSSREGLPNFGVYLERRSASGKNIF